MARNKKESWLTQEERDRLIEGIQQYFLDERDEELGRIAADSLLDFFCEELEPLILPRCIERFRDRLMLKLDDAEVETLSFH